MQGAPSGGLVLDRLFPGIRLDSCDLGEAYLFAQEDQPANKGHGYELSRMQDERIADGLGPRYPEEAQGHRRCRVKYTDESRGGRNRDADSHECQHYPGRHPGQ